MTSDSSLIGVKPCGEGVFSLPQDAAVSKSVQGEDHHGFKQPR
jgi:hypothetical protein